MLFLLLSTLSFLAVTKKSFLEIRTLSGSKSAGWCTCGHQINWGKKSNWFYISLKPKKSSLNLWLQIMYKIGKAHTECQSHTDHEMQSLRLKFDLCQSQWIKFEKRGNQWNEIKIEEGGRSVKRERHSGNIASRTTLALWLRLSFWTWIYPK